MPTYRRGDIVFARVPEPTGAPINHDHPVIIWTPTAKIIPGTIIDTVVIGYRKHVRAKQSANRKAGKPSRGDAIRHAVRPRPNRNWER